MERKNELDDYESFQEIRSDAEVDLSLLLFRQLDRINLVRIKDSSRLREAVLGLEVLLHPYKDDKFKEDVTKLNLPLTSWENQWNKLSAGQRTNSAYKGQDNKIRLELSEKATQKMLFALVSLMDRNNLYPKKLARGSV